MTSTLFVPPSHADDRGTHGLAALAVALGEGGRFVQGAGGNLSVKQDGTLWVKASGTRFGDAARTSIFVAMDLRCTRARAVLDEDLRASVIRKPGVPETLRPSIEAAFHALMPQTVVAHVHSIGAVAAAIGPRDRALQRLERLGTVHHVPYRRPGRPLAAALVASGATDGDPRAERIVLLANHGLIVAAATTERVFAVLNEVERALAPAEPPVLDGEAVASDGWSRLFGPGTVDGAARGVLLGGVLTPDSAVFLGRRPFGALDDRSSSCAVHADGSVWIRASLSRDAAGVAASLVAVAGLVDGPAAYLSDADVAELVDWDAEKWRQEQQR